MKKIDEIRKKMKEEKPDDESDDKFLSIIKYARTMKRNMNAKGIRGAKAKCPYCDGFWHGRISSYNGHIHIRCDGPCNTYMME